MPGAGRTHNTLAAVALVVLALATVALGTWTVSSASRQQAQLSKMQTRLDGLESQEELVAAELQAVPSTGSAITGRQPSGTVASGETTDRPRTQVAARFLSFAARPYGWDVVIRPGHLYRGDAAFALATSRGDLPHNDIYVDSATTRTVSLRLVRAAPVMLLGWHRAGGSVPASATTADLAKVAGVGASGRAPWAGMWYLVTIPDNRTIVSVEELNTK